MATMMTRMMTISSPIDGIMRTNKMYMVGPFVFDDEEGDIRHLVHPRTVMIGARRLGWVGLQQHQAAKGNAFN